MPRWRPWEETGIEVSTRTRCSSDRNGNERAAVHVNGVTKRLVMAKVNLPKNINGLRSRDLDQGDADPRHYRGAAESHGGRPAAEGVWRQRGNQTRPAPVSVPGNAVRLRLKLCGQTWTMSPWRSTWKPAVSPQADQRSSVLATVWQRINAWGSALRHTAPDFGVVEADSSQS